MPITFIIGCETDAQKMADVHAQEEITNAKLTLAIAHDQANLAECHEHLPNGSKEWLKFKKSHWPTEEVTGIDDTELKECLAVGIDARLGATRNP